MSDLIAADQADDAERWQLPSIAAAGEGGRTAPADSARSTQALEELQKQARQEGYEDGRKKGLADGAAEAARQAEALSALVAAIKAPLHEADEAFLQEMGRLVLRMTRAVVGAELRLQPEHVVELVRKAVGELPAETRKVRIELHPQDVAVVREHVPELEHDGRAVLRDQPQLARGECVVSSEGAHVDATIEARLATLAEQVLGDATGGASRGAPEDGA